jgi:hypothetical protein
MFKIGEKVKCIDAEEFDFLLEEEYFIVYSIKDEYIRIKNSLGQIQGGFYTYRFIHYPYLSENIKIL